MDRWRPPRAAALLLLAAACSSGVEVTTDPRPTSTEGPAVIRSTIVGTEPSSLPTTSATHTSPSDRIGRWEPIPEAPVGRSHHVAVWTGQEMLVWGTLEGPLDTKTGGGAYNPTTQAWRTLEPAPELRSLPAAAWTGSELLIWGGAALSPVDGDTVLADDGFAYDPAADAWSPIPPAPITGRDYMFAVWTGEELIVWGGMVPRRPFLQGATNDGAAYHPATKSWRKLPPAPLGPKNPGVAVWTGEVMIIGGNGDATDGDPGWAAYDPLTEEWAPLPDPPIAASSVVHGVWTGEEVLFAPVVGFRGTPVMAALDPDAGSWRLTSPPPLPIGQIPAVWNGQVVVFWGRAQPGASAGLAYEPDLDRWRQLQPTPLAVRSGHTLVAADGDVIIWGGQSSGELLADGALLVLTE